MTARSIFKFLWMQIYKLKLFQILKDCSLWSGILLQKNKNKRYFDLWKLTYTGGSQKLSEPFTAHCANLNAVSHLTNGCPTYLKFLWEFSWLIMCGGYAVHGLRAIINTLTLRVHEIKLHITCLNWTTCVIWTLISNYFLKSMSFNDHCLRPLASDRHENWMVWFKHINLKIEISSCSWFHKKWCSN
jgi:hypothetical protein